MLKNRINSFYVLRGILSHIINAKLSIYCRVIGYFDNGTISETVEVIDNKLKLIKRSGYGFRNSDNLRTRYLLNWT